MSKIFSRASDDVSERIGRLIEANHTDLSAARVRIDLLFIARDEDKPGPVLKLHGVAAAAIASLITTKARAAGRGDCEILIDEEFYEKLSPAARDALLDHELEHFIVQRDKHGIFKIDAQERPKMRIKPHDHDFGWFDSIAKRHGAAALEVRQARQFAQLCGQIYFDFPAAAKA